MSSYWNNNADAIVCKQLVDIVPPKLLASAELYIKGLSSPSSAKGGNLNSALN